MKQGKILVAMSGGVDSSVTAALLLEQKHNVIGATMLLYNDNGIQEQSIVSAKAVAQKLGIDHYVFDLRKEFRSLVIDEFVCAYAIGRTPNPCIICNEHMKFGKFWVEAQKLGCQYIATGHYARIEEKHGHFRLRKASNLKKDQSYVLYRLKQDILHRILFPLGDFTSKEEIRALAEKFSLPVAGKADSQDICFIPDGDTRKFLLEQSPALQKNGNIIMADNGKIIGQHDGIAFYTIGQRKGLGIVWEQPLYVSDIQPDTNNLIVSTHENIFANTLYAKNLSFTEKLPVADYILPVVAKIRYAHKEEPATLKMLANDKCEVIFHHKQRAITPGQSIVFYDGEYVLGGGIIDRLCF